MAVALSPDQELATKAFLDALSESGASCVSRATAIKFLLARKFDVARAHALWRQHEATRRREGLNKFEPFEEPLKSELETGKFTILPTRDATGAAIAVFTANKHFPAQTSHQTTLQGVVYQLDIALQSVETQRAGLVFIYDMTDSKYTNFDYELSQKILTMLKETIISVNTDQQPILKDIKQKIEYPNQNNIVSSGENIIILNVDSEDKENTVEDQIIAGPSKSVSKDNDVDESWNEWTPKSLKRPISEALKVQSKDECIKRRRPKNESLADTLMQEKIKLVKILQENALKESHIRLAILEEQLKQEQLKTKKLTE